MAHNHNTPKGMRCLVLVLGTSGAGNGDPQALFIAIAWLEAVGGNDPKADPQNYNYT
jgi:hypothetical protein